MKLSLKQKALAHTVGMFTLAIATAVVINLILANVSATVIGYALAIGLFAFFGYMFYGITLGRLEYNEKLKELNK